MTKTNAMRMLDRAKIKYDVLQYDYDESDLSGVHAAEALSLDPNQVFKTLVTRGGRTDFSCSASRSVRSSISKNARNAPGSRALR